MFGKEMEIVFMGLRYGEKLHEELLGDGELSERPLHPMISQVVAPPLDPDDSQTQPWARAAAGSRRLGSVPRYENSAV